MNKKDVLTEKVTDAIRLLLNYIDTRPEDQDARLDALQAIRFLEQQLHPDILDEHELNIIKDYGINAFHRAIKLPDNPKAAQVHLVIEGLAEYLLTQDKILNIKTRR